MLPLEGAAGSPSQGCEGGNYGIGSTTTGRWRSTAAVQGGRHRPRTADEQDAAPAVAPPDGPPPTLPDPVFPRRAELLRGDDADVPENLRDYRRKWTAPLILRAMRGWIFPYVKSRLLPGDFQPIIAYRFTEYKCNLDSHYCWERRSWSPGSERCR